MFTANTQHPLFKDINRIIMKMVGVEYLMDYILQHVGQLECVYLVGELAKGQNSDTIEIILIGTHINQQFLNEQVDKAEKKINKKIQYLIFTSEEFEQNKNKDVKVKPLLLWNK